MIADMIYQKVKEYILQYQMIEQGDFVAAGVSGGADSVCLLYLLRRLQKEISYQLAVVHVNHGVREDAVKDAAYAMSLCERLNVPFYLKEVDMYEYAALHKLSPEEAGRVLRYQAFWEVINGHNEKGDGKIAVAHNANDRAETMLFHMFRGSGLEGLGSIRPVRERVIRPVLCLTREEIEDYLKEQGIAYCQDSSNAEDMYARNRIRHHILPYAEREICARAVSHMNELADILTETEAYLRQETERLFRKHTDTALWGEGRKEDITQDGAGERTSCNNLCIRGEGLLTEAPVMIKRVLLYALEYMTPHRKDITRKHIADLEGLLHKSGSKELYLPHGIRVYKEYGNLILQRVDASVPMQDKAAREQKSFVIEPPAEVCIPDVGCFSFTLLDRDLFSQEHAFCQKAQNIPENRYTKWFDYDKITTSLLLRTRQAGDYLAIDKALHTKSLKQYMINEKIPKMQRDSMYVLADGSHILWVPDHRISQYYKVDESTKCILQVQLRGGYHGGTN